LFIPDIHSDPRFLDKTGTRKRTGNRPMAFLCVPIKSEGATLGALSALKDIDGKEDAEEDMRFLKIMASMIAQAVKLNRRVLENRKDLQEENQRLRQDLKQRFSINNMIGNSNAMQEVYKLIEQVADSNATVLIRGESGTGKELVAHALHYNSPRANKPFIKVNCNAFPETLLESELFGHEKGAFTGAVERKIGRFEWAQDGTLFLDEIGDFPLSLQVKLLRVIQTKEFERLGGRSTIKANVRLVVATNKNLEMAITESKFREDLFYRINVFPIFLPPLRERKDDIMQLADYFLEKFAKENNKDITRISTPAIDLLTSYHWPGNIRELENCMERAVLLVNEGVVRSEHLPPSLQRVDSDRGPQPGTFFEIIAKKEQELIVDALKKSRGHQKRAGSLLGLTERIFNYKIQKYGINPRSFKG
jgi:Nif-specific regulatory protein